MKTSIVCTVTLLTVLLAGCIAQPIAPTPATIAAEVRAGDRIRLVTSSGLAGDYRVVRVDREALYLQPLGRKHEEPKQSIAFSDIREVTVTRTNNKAAISAGLVIATIVVGAAFYEAMEAAAAPALCC